MSGVAIEPVDRRSEPRPRGLRGGPARRGPRRSLTLLIDARSLNAIDTSIAYLSSIPSLFTPPRGACRTAYRRGVSRRS